MINLAGNADADTHIQEELYLANIPTRPQVSTGEVPYTIVGQLNSWTFRRLWYYYSARGPGLPYDIAVKLHESPNPIDPTGHSSLGEVVRVNGHAGCPHPQDFRYSTLEGIEEECVEARKKYPKITFDSKKAFTDASLVYLNGVKYIRLYHIDSIVGLKEFAKAVREVSNWPS